jgi:hypothetical protein
LVNIFKAWLPQTTLSADRRLTLLDDLLQRHPDVAWRLLIELLPDPHAVGSPTYAPKYRTWKPGDELRVSREEFWSFTDFIVDRVLREVMNNIDRWAQVIEKLADLSLQQRDRVRHQLSELTENSSTALSPGGRRLAWEALDNLIRQHRTYSNTAWAIPENELSQLAEIAEQIKPADLPDQVRWLFDEHVPDLGQGRRADVVDYQELLFQERVRAARKVFASGGLEGVIGLARECKLPWVLGFALADTSLKPDEEQIVSLLDNEDLKLVDFAKGYGSRRLRLEAERGEG